MNRFITLSLVAIFAALITSTTFAQPAPEVRALWISRFEWPNASQTTAKANIDNIMATAAANRFNTVLFQVRGQCDVHYPSPYEPWSNTYNWTDPGWDPLAYAIAAAHSHGLEFHAYINTHTLSQPIPPGTTVPEHPYNLHGPNVPLAQSWLIRDVNGNTLTSDNYHWISPGIPEASSWTRQQILYIVQNYDVDGVHFDRIRTPSPNYSYDPITVARFNGDGNPDSLSWANFMRSQITRDLRNIYGEIMLYKPHVKLSAAPFGIMYKDATTHYQGTGTQAYHQWYQDGWGWLQSGVLDFMVPQIYWQVGSAHPFELLLADWMERRGSRWVVAGSTTSGGGKSVSALLAEHDQTRLQNASGHCIFSFSSMGNYWSAFSTGPYDEVTTVPQMPWKATPEFGYIVGTVTNLQGQPILDARINLDGDSYNYLSAYDGFYAILDVPTTHSLQVSASKTGVGTAVVTGINVTPGQATVVDLVLRNSFGILSLDKDIYGISDNVVLHLEDSDLDGQGSAAVTIAGPTEPGGEAVILTEISPGIFTGQIALGSGAAAADGILQVSHADVITAEYQDADDGSGSPRVASDTAAVDALPPAILSVQIGAVTGTTAQVTITTDEPVTLSVVAGVTCGAATHGAVSNVLQTVHSVTITGLAPGTAYDFSVAAVDTANNMTVDDNSGSCYTFTTATNPGLPFIEDFESGTFEFPWVITGTNQFRTLATQESGPAHGGSYHMRMDDTSGDSVYSLNRATITLDLDRYKNVVMEFWAREFGDESHPAPAAPFGDSANFDGVAVSADGVNWYEIQPLTTLSSTYQRIVVDLDAAVAGLGLSYTSDFRIRFCQYDNFSVSTDGIAIDDIMITGEIGNDLEVLPFNGLSSFGPEGGPFSPTCRTYVLTNEGASTLNWSAAVSVSWAASNPPSGSLDPATSTTIDVCLTNEADLLPEGTHSGTVVIENLTGNFQTTRTLSLRVLNPPLPAVNPTPADGATNVSVFPVLDWVNGGGAVSYSLYFGTTQNPPFLLSLPSEGAVPGFVLPEEVLNTSQTYYWRVDSINDAGVTPGPLWSFTTVLTGNVNYLTERFNGNNDLDNRTVTFRPNGSPGFYAVCNEPAAALPTNPSGGAALTLSDDSSVQIDLTGGAQVHLFGQSYSSFHVGSNGYVTFGSGDSDFSESYYDHFQRQRIAALFDDLNPADGGQISWLQLSDRVAVTFQNVPEFGNSSSLNTFQFELFFSGTIRMTWLTMGASDGLAGLSRGSGIPDDFRKTDFTLFGACLPPTAPGPLTAAPQSQTEILLSWFDNSTDETTITVERLDNGNFIQIAEYPPNTVNYLDDALTPGTSYTYRVGFANIWTSSYSNESSTSTLPLAPEPPADLQVITLSQAELKLTWLDESDNEEGFIVARMSEGGSEFEDIATLDPGTQEFTDGGLAADTQYTYTVRAFNISGEASSASAVGRTLPNPPAAPIGVVAGAVDQTHVQVDWTDASDNETSFAVERSLNGNDYILLSDLPADSVSYNDSSAEPANNYRYRVRAWNSGGHSAYTYSNEATTPPNPPSAPESLTATVNHQRSISLAWVDTSDNETTFTLERSENGGVFQHLADLPADTEAFSDETAQPATTYAYRVSAKNSGGTSGYAFSGDVVTPPDPPAAPSNLVGASTSSTSVDLTWTDNSGNEDGFVLERRIEGAETDFVTTLSQNASAYTDTGLSPGTLYIYRLKAFNSGGESAYSNDAVVLTASIPAAPSNLVGSAVSPSSADLAWTDNSSNENGFILERRIEGAEADFAVTLPQNTNSYTDNGLVPGTSYIYRVKAFNPIGESGYSNDAGVQTSLGIPPAPVLLSATGRPGRIDLVWQSGGGVVTAFHLERSLGETGWQSVSSFTPLQTSYSDQDLVSYMAWSYRLRAQNDHGYSDYSNILTAQSLAEPGTMLHRLVNPSPARRDQFGWATAARNGLIVVGAPADDAGARDAGAVHVFDAFDGALKLTIANPAPSTGDKFGWAVAVMETAIVVGSPMDDTAGRNAGAVYVFNTAGTLLGSLTNPNHSSGDRFGWAISVSENRILVGSPGEAGESPGSGMAHLFDLQSLAFLRSIGNPSPATDDQFGFSVGITSGTLVVGAPMDDAAGSNAGAAHMFSEAGDLLKSWTGNSSRDMFGYSVASHPAGHILVGAPADESDAPPEVKEFLPRAARSRSPSRNTGLVWLFTGDTHVQPARTAGVARDSFGAAVAFTGSWAVAGAPGADGSARDAGSVFAFTTSGIPAASRPNPAPATSDRFGQAVGGDAVHIAVGAPFDDAGSRDSGIVYVFAGPGE